MIGLAPYGQPKYKDLIIKEKDHSTGKLIDKRYVVKDVNHRKGETVLREVRTLA